MSKFNSSGMLEPQVPHAIFLANALETEETGNVAFDPSPTGTGKTFSGAGVLRHLKGRKFIVLCPKLGIPKWAGVLALFGLKAQTILNYEIVARGNTKIYSYHERGLNPSGIPWSDTPWFLRGKWNIPSDWIIILDESHRCKGIESLNSGMMFAAKQQGIAVLCLSATQAMVPMDMRAFGYLMGLHKGMHFMPGRGQNNGMNIFKYDFCEAAGAQFTGSFGAMTFDGSDPVAQQKLYEVVHKQLFDVLKIAHRMKREDFGDIFAHNQIEAQSYDMGENGRKIDRIYGDMQQELAKLQARVDGYKDHILAIITAARRKVELLKVPSLCEIAEDMFAEGKSIGIFVNYTDTIDAMYSRLSKTFGEKWIGKIHGEQTTKQRWDDINAFQEDKKRILLINIAAGSELIDLQDLTGKHPRVALINPSYRAISVVQSIGRMDRAHAKSDIITNLVLASGTIEDSVGRKFNDKKAHLDLLNDGALIPDGIGFEVASRVGGMNI